MRKMKGDINMKIIYKGQEKMKISYNCHPASAMQH